MKTTETWTLLRHDEKTLAGFLLCVFVSPGEVVGGVDGSPSPRNAAQQHMVLFFRRKKKEMEKKKKILQEGISCFSFPHAQLPLHWRWRWCRQWQPSIAKKKKKKVDMVKVWAQAAQRGNRARKENHGNNARKKKKNNAQSNKNWDRGVVWKVEKKKGRRSATTERGVAVVGEQRHRLLEFCWKESEGRGRTTGRRRRPHSVQISVF